VTAPGGGWIELGQSAWADYLRALSLECAGSPTALRTARVAGEPFAPHSVLLLLREIRYDRRLDVFELSVGATTADTGPLLRCFVSTPRRILARESRHSRSLLIIEHGGVEALEVRLVPVAGEAASPEHRAGLAGELAVDGERGG
jgi:hypothetical protein